jgi:hypothetical protein
MPFKNIEHAEERGALTVALEENCAENGIDAASDDYNLARELLIILYHTHASEPSPISKPRSVRR